MSGRGRARLVFLAAALTVLSAVAWFGARVLAASESESRAAAREDHLRAIDLALWRLDAAASAAIVQINALDRAPALAAAAPPPRRPIVLGRFSALRDGAIELGPDAALPALDPARRLAPGAVRDMLRAVEDASREATSLPALSAPLHVTEVGPFDDDFTLRNSSNVITQNALIEAQMPRSLDARAPTAMLVPAWLDAEDHSPLLVMAAMDQQGARGVLLDADGLEDVLLAHVTDLFPAADLVPRRRDQADRAAMSLLPFRLETNVEPKHVGPAPATVTAVVLGGLAVLVAIGFVGIALERGLGAAEARARFATALAHELRTPLTSFRLYASLLARGDAAEEAQRRSWIDALEGEAVRMSGVVEALVLVFRESEGRLVEETLAASALLERLRPELERIAASHDARLTIDDGSAGAAITVDPRLVALILANLIDNACRHGEAARTGGVALRAEASTDRVMLAVVDRGPGLSRRRARRLLHGGDVGAERSGLGLFLAAAMARALGGELELRRNEAPGTSIVLDLPRVTASS